MRDLTTKEKIEIVKTIQEMYEAGCTQEETCESALSRHPLVTPSYMASAVAACYKYFNERRQHA